MRSFAAILMLAGLAACSGGSGSIPILTDASVRPQAKVAKTFRAPQLSREPGLEALIGARAQTLLSRLGKPRIDLTEGDARKLQFASEKCVLDIYLYPLQAGKEPVATHVEARLRAGGTKADKTWCLNQIARR